MSRTFSAKYQIRTCSPIVSEIFHSLFNNSPYFGSGLCRPHPITYYPSTAVVVIVRLRSLPSFRLQFWWILWRYYYSDCARIVNINTRNQNVSHILTHYYNVQIEILNKRSCSERVFLQAYFVNDWLFFFKYIWFFIRWVVQIYENMMYDT